MKCVSGLKILLRQIRLLKNGVIQKRGKGKKMQAYLVAVELRGSIRSALIENGHIHMILNLVMSRGAYEVNPIMAYVLDVSPSAFVTTKYVLTCVAALIVLMLRDVVVVRGKKLPPHVLLYFFVWGFALVVAWELYLFSIIAT